MAYNYYNDNPWIWRFLSKNIDWKNYRCRINCMGYFYSIINGCCTYKYFKYGFKLKTGINSFKSTRFKRDSKEAFCKLYYKCMETTKNNKKKKEAYIGR